MVGGLRPAGDADRRRAAAAHRRVRRLDRGAAEPFLRAAPFGVFTFPINLSGQPAISVPVHWSAVGLPVGAMLVAPFGREDLLLQVAAQLEVAVPWRDRVPGIYAG